MKTLSLFHKINKEKYLKNTVALINFLHLLFHCLMRSEVDYAESVSHVIMIRE